MAIKLILGLKGKSKTVEIADSKAFSGKKIGDSVKGELIDMPGYEFQITGGSDTSGFPMRWDVEGSQKRKIFAISGVGLKKKARGIKQKKTVGGNTVGASIAAINLKVVKEGKQKLFEEPKAEEPAAENAESAPEEKSEAPAEEKAAE